MIAPAGTARKPGPHPFVAVAVMVLGFLIVVVAVIRVVAPIVRAVETSPPQPVPGGVAHLHLTPGTYRVYERTGTITGSGGLTFSHNDAVAIRAGDVSVTGPGGSVLPAYDVGPNETITRNRIIFTAAVGFKVPATGDYEVTILAGRQGQVLVNRSLGDSVRAALGRIAVAGVGMLILIGGVALLIIGIVRRGRVRRIVAPAGQPMLPPPGWYPDPGQPGRSRYWDGIRWGGGFPG